MSPRPKLDTVRSSLADTARLPSGVSATAVTMVRMPFERAQHLTALEIPDLER